jgi:hypothetical protein
MHLFVEVVAVYVLRKLAQLPMGAGALTPAFIPNRVQAT